MANNKNKNKIQSTSSVPSITTSHSASPRASTELLEAESEPTQADAPLPPPPTSASTELPEAQSEPTQAEAPSPPPTATQWCQMSVRLDQVELQMSVRLEQVELVQQQHHEFIQQLQHELLHSQHRLYYAEQQLLGSLANSLCNLSFAN